MYAQATIVRVARQGNVSVLRLAAFLDNPKPGQFIMLWQPGLGEIPLSIADYESGELLLLITKRGKVTTHIYENAREGQRMFIRGPYGKPYTTPNPGSRILLVGGGSGVAPLHFLAKQLGLRGYHCTAVIGFKSSREALLVDSFSRICRTTVVTEDGTLGEKGLATDTASRLLSSEKFDWIYACGPEQLISKTLSLAIDSEAHFEASLERYMRCAVGICGSCVLEPVGLRVCRDGPVFPREILIKVFQNI
ncbi:MAG: dihydroorotate dehydrogenase electron transfer subunit [Infirmifilum sp.]